MIANKNVWHLGGFSGSQKLNNVFMGSAAQQTTISERTTNTPVCLKTRQMYIKKK